MGLRKEDTYCRIRSIILSRPGKDARRSIREDVPNSVYGAYAFELAGINDLRSQMPPPAAAGIKSIMGILHGHRQGYTE